jgi:hypothetical protein
MNIEFVDSVNRQVFGELEQGACFTVFGDVERSLFVKVKLFSLDGQRAINAVELYTGIGSYFPDNRNVVEYSVDIIVKEIEA